MAALVQPFPAQQSPNTVSLHPQSTTGTIQGPGPISTQVMPRTSSYGSQSSNIGNGTSSFRSYSGSAPVAPYAFTSTPGLNQASQKTQQQQQQQQQQQPYSSIGRQDISQDPRMRYPVSDTSSSSSSISSDQPSRYKNHITANVNSVNPNTQPMRAVALAGLPSPTAPQAATVQAPRPSPDRYRRTAKRADSLPPPTSSSNVSSGPGMAAVGPHYAGPHLPMTNGPGMQGVPPLTSYTGQLRSQSVDDIHTHRSGNNSVQQQQQQIQQRRRSVGAFTGDSLQKYNHDGQGPNNLRSHQLPSFSPHSTNHRMHGSAPDILTVTRRGSNDSSASVHSSSSHRPNSNSNSSPANSMTSHTSHEINPAHVPPRDSSQVTKRTTAPSPLSRPVNLNSEPESSTSGHPKNKMPEPSPSLAAERLAALSAAPPKGFKNRLRRAFSFGSAAELRKAAAGNNTDALERARMRQDKFREEQLAEESRIAQQQEASGLGSTIYSNGQGHVFSGSTDNLSVSSTASSASIMIRKMGKGMKKSTRSLVGLFRPRSVIGVEAASGPVQIERPNAEISVVNVEAELEKTGINSKASDAGGGGTGFTKTESDRSVEGEIKSRGTFSGGEADRAEILATVRKGILKRQGSSSPIIKPADPSAPQIPAISSSAVISDHTNLSSPKAETPDYFKSVPRATHSAPPSPGGSKGNVSFSPRIIYHDTWPSGEYDRRGDIATCNRLTPALAQQIKDELNTFKMEMEVHEESKVYTHFF